MMQGDLDIALIANFENLAVIRGIIRSYLDAENISEKDRVHMIAVIDELATNVMEHAYKGMDIREEEKIIKINISINENTLEVIIEDFGVGYSDGKKSKEEGGMGLSIVKAFVDKFSLINKDKGCKVLIIKTVKKEEE